MWLSLRWPAHEGRRSMSQEMSSFPLFFLHDFLTSHVLTGLIFTALNLLLLPRHLLFSLFVPTLISFLYVSNPPSPFFSLPLSIFFLFLRRPSVYVWKSEQGDVCSQPGRKARKWKDVINKIPALLALKIAIHHVLSLFFLFCKKEVITFYHFTCCLM